MSNQMMVFVLVLVALAFTVWAVNQHWVAKNFLHEALRSQTEESVEDTLQSIRALQYKNPHHRSLENYRESGKDRGMRDGEAIFSELDKMELIAQQGEEFGKSYHDQQVKLHHQVEYLRQLNGNMSAIENWVRETAEFQVQYDVELGNRTSSLVSGINSLRDEISNISRQAEAVREVI